MRKWVWRSISSRESPRSSRWPGKRLAYLYKSGNRILLRWRWVFFWGCRICSWGSDICIRAACPTFQATHFHPTPKGPRRSAKTPSSASEKAKRQNHLPPSPEDSAGGCGWQRQLDQASEDGLRGQLAGFFPIAALIEAIIMRSRDFGLRS